MRIPLILSLALLLLLIASMGRTDGIVYPYQCAPSNGASGEVCWDGVGHKWQYWDGAAWNDVPGAPAANGVPVGASILVTSGSCPTGFTEDTSVQGYFLMAKTATGTAGGTLGTALTGATIPDASYTPLGSNASVSAGTPAGTNSTGTVTPLGSNNACTTAKFTTSGSGTAACSPAFTPVFTGSSSTTSAETFTGSALAAHTHTFTGTANSTMRSTLTPVIQVILCKKT